MEINISIIKKKKNRHYLMSHPENGFENNADVKIKNR